MLEMRGTLEITSGGFLGNSVIDILDWIILCLWEWSGQSCATQEVYTILQSLPTKCQWYICSTCSHPPPPPPLQVPAVIVKISRYCQMFCEGQNHLQLRTIDLVQPFHCEIMLMSYSCFLNFPPQSPSQLDLVRPEVRENRIQIYGYNLRPDLKKN